MANPTLFTRFISLRRLAACGSQRHFHSSTVASLHQDESTTSSHHKLRSVSQQDIEILQSFAGLQPAHEANLTKDWTRHYRNEGDNVVLFPKSTEEVQQIVAYCHEHRIALIPVSGNTGLVGGSMPVVTTETTTGVQMSLTRMNKLYSLQKRSGILHCQAGVILETLQNYATEHDCIVPIDLGAKGSCCIGGNVATNAGGQYYYRYGSIAAHLVGLQVVTGDGRILNLGNRNVLKDNTGYKVHQLFVGSEGTLGIITEVSLVCRPYLHQRETALVACNDFETVLKITDAAKRMLGERLAAVEWMDGSVINLVASTHEHLKIPIMDAASSSTYSHYLLLETHSSHDNGQALFGQFLENLFETDLILDGAIAQDMTDYQDFWNIRESCNPAANATGCTYKYDVSLPESGFESFISIMKERLKDTGAIVTSWGHVLDGNLHFNVTTPDNFEVKKDMKALLEPFVFDQVLKMGGSISAEHGIGQAKASYMSAIHSSDSLVLMGNLKQMLDPHGILNPGKILPTR